MLQRCMPNCGSVPRPTKEAVQGVSLAISAETCFGLLGPNGAGKTSVVNVLSGLVQQSAGKAYVGSFDTRTAMSSIQTVLGVCPQFDTTWADLSVEGHLLLYARLKVRCDFVTACARIDPI